MMFSPPSSPSVLASTSRHNVLQPHQHNEHKQQRSLRLFLGHQSDEEAASDCDFDSHYSAQYDSDSDSDESVLGRASGSTRKQSSQPGRITATRPTANAFESPSRRAVSIRAYDDEEVDSTTGQFILAKRAKRPRVGASPKKPSMFAATATTKQHTATSAAIPTTPTKRQKGFLVRGNVTPSRAFSIFKAAKQRSQQRQQHGLMTPPTSSPLRPIILDSFDDDFMGDVQESPSRRRGRSSPVLVSPSKTQSTLTSSGQKFSTHTPTRSRASHSHFTPSSAFAGANTHPSLPQALQSLRIRQSLHSSVSLHSISRFSSAAYAPSIDTTSFLETFVSPFSCMTQIPRSCDDDLLSHPISAAYSYSSRSVNPTAQWLAVGDDEGRITLLNTLSWQDETAEQLEAHPQWRASSSSAIFEVVWRFDDRSILSGSSDFGIRSWDTEHQKCTGSFEGHNGSPRTIVYDPTTNGDGGCGMVFASAGRDGSVRIWDARVSATGESEEGYGIIRPVLTISAAHGTVAPVAAGVAGKGRKKVRNGTSTGTARGRKKAQQPLPAGVTALSYLPDGQGHTLLSGGSSNGIIKCWDLRHVRNAQPSNPVSQFDPHALSATWETPDLSLLTPSSTTGLGSFKRAHGVSQIISSATSLYASCTGGKIYSLPLSTFLDSHLTSSEVQTLYDPVQCQNTLFSRMALLDDRFLAVGCNTGSIALWDVSGRREHGKRLSKGIGERDVEEERRVAGEMEMGFASRSRENGMAVLTEGHAKNTEVNAVAWANGPNGPTLSSVGDDTKVRSWYGDRVVRESLSRAAEE